MKIAIPHLSILAIFLAAASITMATPHTPPVRSLEIPPTNVIVIDGVADGAYSPSQSTTAFNVTGSTGADADFTMSYQVCYTYSKLYMLFTVLDDYACEIPYTTSVNPWTWDNIEVFLSLDTTGTTAEYDSNTIQLRFNRGIQDSAQSPGRADQSEYAGNVYSENTADGWVLEVGIPWTAVLQEGALPEDIEAFICHSINGFDVSGADNDTDGPDARDCQTAWDDDNPAMPDATEDLARNNRTMFGIMTMMGCCSLETIENPSRIVYPNPASKKIQLQNAEPASTIAIYDLLGVKMLETKLVNSEDYIDVSSLRTGLYTAIINNKEVTRFIKE